MKKSLSTLGLGFIANPLDRAAHRKEIHFLEKSFTDKSTRFILMKNLNPLMLDNKISLSSYQYEFSKYNFAYLGSLNQNIYFCVDVTSSVSTFKGEFIDCFKVIQELSPEEGSILGQARNVLDWLSTTIFCTKCGKKMVTSFDGYLKTCDDDKIRLYPRVNPVVIMLITNVDGSKILLGGNKRAKGKYVSCLAGFVDSSETLEDAVVRESMEESAIGIDRDSIQYFTSQPWSFQQNNNLMVGFTARAKSDKITCDDKELDSVEWFDRNSVLALFEESSPMKVPGPYALAHHLIRKWLDDTKGNPSG